MIPKAIHHVWPGDDEFRYAEWRRTWMKYHSDWTFYFWRLDNLPEGILETTKKVISDDRVSYVVKSDLIRLEVIRLFGGIFVCTDMECQQSFEKFLKYTSFCGTFFHTICNALFGAEKGNKYIEEATIKVGENICNDPVYASSSYEGVVSMSGGRAIRPFFEKFEAVFENIFYVPDKDSYSVHHWTNSNEGGWTALIGIQNAKNKESLCQV